MLLNEKDRRWVGGRHTVNLECSQAKGWAQPVLFGLNNGSGIRGRGAVADVLHTVFALVLQHEVVFRSPGLWTLPRATKHVIDIA
jgi:hypothetical protein